jgi:hypothetical protein
MSLQGESLNAGEPSQIPDAGCFAFLPPLHTGRSGRSTGQKTGYRGGNNIRQNARKHSARIPWPLTACSIVQQYRHTGQATQQKQN